LAVAGARGVLEVQVNDSKFSSGCVVDSHAVGAAKGVKIDVLDAVKVHHSAADVAGHAHSTSVGRDTEILRCVRTVEPHSIGPALSIDSVAAVAGVPDECVAAVAHLHHVVAGATDHEVSPMAAEDAIVPRAAVKAQPDQIRG